MCDKIVDIYYSVAQYFHTDCIIADNPNLTLITLGKKLCRRHLEILFLFFPEKQFFNNSSKFSPVEKSWFQEK